MLRSLRRAPPRVFDQHAQRRGRFEELLAGDASTSSPNLMTALRAVELLQEEKSLAMESGCALFAALCKEDLIYSQPMNQLTLNLSFLNLNPKKLFCLDLGLGRPLALSGGQLPDEVTGFIDHRSPSVLETLGFGI